MSKIKIITFDQAIKKSAAYNKRHLLVGNGFSIACVPDIFTYRSLFEKANFRNMPEVKELFKTFQTHDFELVINALEQSSLTLPAYGKQFVKIAKKMQEHAGKLKEILIKTIAENHPAYPATISDNKYEACARFLSLFMNSENGGCIYTINYDLLLYWTVMFGKNKELFDILPNDGFGRDTDFEDGESHVSQYVTWQGETSAHGQNIHYLHGALHVFDNGNEVEKYTWIDTGIRLIDQTRAALEQNKFPLFVAEGESKKKMEKILHNGYLYHSYKSFSKIMEKGSRVSDCLFTYGVSFSDNDNHIFKKIYKGHIRKLFVGLYGDPDSEANKVIISKIEYLKSKRKASDLEVEYYDAESAKVWG